MRRAQRGVPGGEASLMGGTDSDQVKGWGAGRALPLSQGLCHSPDQHRACARSPLAQSCAETPQDKEELSGLSKGTAISRQQ